MTFIEAAEAVLDQEGRPLRSREIAEKAVTLGLLSHVGKTPVQTMSARLSATVAKEGSPFVRVRPGIFGLAAWQGNPPGPKRPETRAETPKAAPAAPPAAAADQPPKPVPTAEASPGKEGATPSSTAERPAPRQSEEASPEDRRAQPEAQRSEPGPGRSADGQPGKRRKRKKRKASHAPPSDVPAASDGHVQPAAAAVQRREEGAALDAPPVALPTSGPPDRPHGKPAPLAEPPPAGTSGEHRTVDLLQEVEAVLRRNARPIPVEKVLEAVGLKGESGQTLIEALMASDAIERERMGQRPRFVKHKSGYALLERETSAEIIALENQGAELRARMIQIAEKQLLRKLRGMPMNSFVRILIHFLQRSGYGAMMPVSFHRNGEFHLAARDRRHRGHFSTAVVLRKDAADFELRERSVMDLRGTLHHYEAMNGVIITTGLVSDKAVKEGRIPNLPPIALMDGDILSREMVQLGIGVKVRTLRLPLFDDAFFSSIET